MKTRTAARLATVLLVMLLVALATGCQHHVRLDNPPHPIEVLVSNRGFYNVTVYALPADGMPGVRIGEVHGLSSETLRVRADLLHGRGALTLQVRAMVTKEVWTSQALLVSEDAEPRLDILMDSRGRMDQTALYLSSD